MEISISYDSNFGSSAKFRYIAFHYQILLGSTHTEKEENQNIITYSNTAKFINDQSAQIQFIV
jgi:hypothetical protein